MWLYAFIPVLVTAAGAIWTSFRRPTPVVVGAIQHFAAGVVFYAAAGELLPDTIHQGAIWPVVLGGALGIAAMLLLDHLTERSEGPVGLTATSALDALVDGLVLGLAFNAGQSQGILLAIALAIEFLFLGLSIAGAFQARESRLKIIVVATAVSLAVPVGVLIAGPIGTLPETWQAVAFAFGLVALLYLVTEELLVEAHQKPHPHWSAAMFFVGFLALAVVNELMIPA